MGYLILGFALLGVVGATIFFYGIRQPQRRRTAIVGSIIAGSILGPIVLSCGITISDDASFLPVMALFLAIVAVATSVVYLLIRGGDVDSDMLIGAVAGAIFAIFSFLALALACFGLLLFTGYHG